MIPVEHLKSRILLVALLAVVAVLPGCSDEASDTPTQPGSKTVSEVEFQSFQLVNVERRDNGVKPQLDLKEAISAVARAHSEDMRDNGFFSHRGSNGDTITDRLAAAGIKFTVAAENLVKVNSSIAPALAAHDMLMESGDHRDNILDKRFRRLGVGVARSGNTYWITQIFIKP